MKDCGSRHSGLRQSPVAGELDTHNCPISPKCVLHKMGSVMRGTHLVVRLTHVISAFPPYLYPFLVLVYRHLSDDLRPRMLSRLRLGRGL